MALSFCFFLLCSCFSVFLMSVMTILA
jgi:hypothetical protein